MCNKTVILLLIFIVKLLIIFVIPYLLFFKKISNYRTFNILYIINISLLGLFSILLVMNNKCIVNSTLSGINNSFMANSTSKKVVKESNDADTVSQIVTNKKYKTNNLSDVYYFNNNIQPLSDKKINCNGETKYMKQYGNGITTVSMMVSTILNQNIDPIEILNLAVKNDIFDCNTGVNINLLLNVVSEEYNISFREIDSDLLWDYVYSGNVVLEEIAFNKNTNNNLTCSKGNILIYSVDNNYNFQILNPNNSNEDYICPDNTPGSMMIIKAKSNDNVWTINQLNNIKSRYIVGERN